MELNNLSLLCIVIGVFNVDAFTLTPLAKSCIPVWQSVDIRYKLPYEHRSCTLQRQQQNLPLHLFPHFLDGSSSELLAAGVNQFQQMLDSIPFQDLGRELSDALDVGAGLSNDVGKIPERETSLVLESIGFDLLIFLTASVIVMPIAKALKITPILGYLLAGALLGPHGIDMFSNSKADVELGDFGILFLLFSEGLDVSRDRLKQLSNYLPLGMAQISLVTGVITAFILNGIPRFFAEFLPLDTSVLPIGTPLQAVVLGLTGSLSTSAFIFPVLKEREWEDEEAGQAATSILLLQDLMVAPLLVLLPYLAGQSEASYAAIAFLTLKATVGFGLVIYAGSYVLRQLFGLIAQTQSSETFVALCLLVSVGMGVIAKSLGLTDTAGAFAAGVLLANSFYRAQIQADILPFKGILLGIFFMDAGSNFDVDLVQREWTTVFAGVISLLVIKAVTLGLATRVPRWMEPNRLPAPDALRIALLLAGGGEFAFVVLALAEKLKILPPDLGALLTAVVLITMGLTPVLGDAAAKLSEPLLPLKEDEEAGVKADLNVLEQQNVASNSIVVCGYGEVGQSVVRSLASVPPPTQSLEHVPSFAQQQQIPYVVAFDTDPYLAVSSLRPSKSSVILFGNGANSEVIRSSGIEKPSCIFVTYETFNRVSSAVARLRSSYGQTIPIYARASTRFEADALKAVGATEVVVESDELPKCAADLFAGTWKDEVKMAQLSSEGELDTDRVSDMAYLDGVSRDSKNEKDDPDSKINQFRSAAAAAAGVPLSQVNALLDLYKGMDIDGSGNVTLWEIDSVLRRSTFWVASDEDIEFLDTWLKSALDASDKKDQDQLERADQSVSALDFCRMVGKAPDRVRRAFGITIPKKEVVPDSAET